MALFFGEHTLQESGMGIKLTPDMLFNPNLLSETATVQDLGIAVGEAMDFLRENFEPVEKLDFVYESTKVRSNNKMVINESYQQLTEGVGEFMGKLKEWAMKIWNSIKAFISNTWLKITNRWAYRDKMIKDKEIIAAIELSKNEKDKWEGKRVSMYANDAVAVATEYAGIVLKYDGETTESSTISDDMKDFVEKIDEREEVSGDDLLGKLDAARAFYATKATQSIQLIKKMEASIGKMIDQFVKDLKTTKGADDGVTTAMGKLHYGKVKKDDTTEDTTKIGVGFGKTAAVSHADMAQSGLTIKKAKQIIPAMAKVLHKSCAAIKNEADVYFKVLQIAASIGGKTLSDIKSAK